ncbi:hypothetical protein A946_10020 [Methylacidiphilum kamchatkense Kam1]|uniref:RNA polymerase primary sigma factor n=1 Tax=Methylacidiphilum kamchatkense Kam1 TaxID=1202785 RepID=A0A0C1RSQ5_9BACT|nr:hypothetical protein [Methylacidiphilum kamchatkense]KIE57976.1 hypothetical protein A946_10020 [Methylacidiphilum kamchatkense Kam1]QDQ42409.1 RNA polymerase primary sigma factor [Methylacidiphilum kamchatkense Kam1]
MRTKLAKSLDLVSNQQHHSAHYEQKFKEELPLILRAKAADAEALEWLAKNSLPIRQQVARFYLPNLADQWPDAENVGWIGILDALEKWNENFNIRFLDYAIHHVRNRVRNYANACRATVRRPASMYRSYRKIERFLEQGLTVEEITELYGCSLHDMEKILHVYSGDLSLHFSALDDSETSLMDLLVYPDNTAEEEEKEEKLQKLSIALSHLDDISRKIVLYFFGIEGEGAKKRPTAWIAQKLRLSRKKVLQLLEKSLNQLKRDFFLFETLNIRHPLPTGISSTMINVNFYNDSSLDYE